MGASFDYRVIETNSLEKARKQFDREVSESQYQNGREYSGCIGMLEGCGSAGPEKDTIEEAVDYIEENHNKWDNAMVVKATKGEQTPSSKKKEAKLSAEVHKAEANLNQIEGKIRKEIVNQKSKFRGCGKCKSRVNKDFLQGQKTSCPVCGESYKTITHQKRIKAFVDKLEKAQKARKDFKPTVKKGKAVYVIGGWCAS